MANSRKYLKMIRPWDIIIVVALMLASFIPYVVFARQQAEQAKQAPSGQVLTAVVTHNGKEVYKIKLTGHRGVTRYRFKNGKEYNDILTTNNQIQIIDANCPDQVCVKKGKISKAGQTIVCLPHKLLVEIKSSRPSHTGAGGMVTE